MSTTAAAQIGSAGPQINETPKPAIPPPNRPPAMMLPCRATSLTLFFASMIRSVASRAVTISSTLPRTCNFRMRTLTFALERPADSMTE